MTDTSHESKINTISGNHGGEIPNKKRIVEELSETTSRKYCKVREEPEECVSGNNTCNEEAKSCFDVCESLNLKDGDRIEVLWSLMGDVSSPRKKEEVEDRESLDNSETVGAVEEEEEEKQRWWGATLRFPESTSQKFYTFSAEEDDDEEEKFESITHPLNNKSCIMVPIRVLQYDPYAEGGYPESSCSEVAFISDRLVYDVELHDHLVFRREGSIWEPNDEDDTDADPVETTISTSIASPSIGVSPCGNTRESLLPVLESVLGNLLSKYQPKMSSLSADRQHWIADCILQAKESLADKIVVQMERCQSNVVTADLVKVCMEEVGKELALKGLAR